MPCFGRGWRSCSRSFVFVIGICLSCLPAKATGAYIEFTVEPQDAVVVSGSDVTLSCGASSTCGSVDYSWSVNATNAVTSQGTKGEVIVENIDRAVLVACFARCDVGAVASRTALVQVAFLSISISTYESVSIPDHAPLLLGVPYVKSMPQPAYSWKKLRNGRYENISNESYVSIDGSLFLASAWKSRNDDGTYQLYATNPILTQLGRVLVKQFKVTFAGNTLSPTSCPNDTLVTMRPLRSATAAAGSNAHFDCFAAAVQCGDPVTTSWKFGSVQLSTTRTLNIKSITDGFQGVHTCRSSVKGKLLEQQMTITVTEKPSFTVFPRNLITVKRPTTFYISSGKVKGSTSSSWFYNGYKVSYGKKFVLMRDNTLQVMDGAHNDAGLYQIVYSNLAGSVSSTIRVVFETSCGGIIKARSGNISLYRTTVANFRDRFECNWFVQFGARQRTAVQFHKFDFDTTDCRNSRVDILEEDGNFALMNKATFCSFQLPGDEIVNLDGSEFGVRVQSKKSLISKGGFVLSFKEVIEVTTVVPPASSSTRTSSVATRLPIKPSSSQQSSSAAVVTSSAILVPSSGGDDSGSGGIIVGVVLGLLLPMAAALAITVFLCRRKKNAAKDTEMVDMQCNRGSVNQVQTTPKHNDVGQNGVPQTAGPSGCSTTHENNYTAAGGSDYMPLVYPSNSTVGPTPADHYTMMNSKTPPKEQDDLYYSIANNTLPSRGAQRPVTCAMGTSAPCSTIGELQNPLYNTVPEQLPLTPVPEYAAPLYATMPDNVPQRTTEMNDSSRYSNPVYDTSKRASCSASSNDTTVTEGIYNDIDYSSIDEEPAYECLAKSSRLTSDTSNIYQPLEESERRYEALETQSPYAELNDLKESDDIYSSLQTDS